MSSPSRSSEFRPAPLKRNAINRLRPAFRAAVKNHDFFRANAIAMDAVEKVFKSGQQDPRQALWENFYSRLAGKAVVQYQCYDFESVDYRLYPIDGVDRLLRGPKPELAAAEKKYVTFMGAAQFFGRHRSKAIPMLVAEKTGAVCLNLGISGAGPDFFLSDEVLRIANAGGAVVLQIMSGRSVGCDEYPGGDVTRRKDSNKKVKRLVLLAEIWKESRDEALRLVRKWQRKYVEVMSHLIANIKVPVVLVWLSPRTPDHWSLKDLEEAGEFGKFPQLVDGTMLAELFAKAAELVVVQSDEGLPEHIFSRFSGEKCPVFERDGSLRWINKYYPSSLAVEQASTEIAGALRTLHVC